MRSLVVWNYLENFRHSAAMRNLGRLRWSANVLRRQISGAIKAVYLVFVLKNIPKKREPCEGLGSGALKAWIKKFSK